MKLAVHARILALMLAALLSRAAAAGAEAPTVRAGHPRVIATAEDFADLRDRRAGDPVLAAMLDGLEVRARVLLDAPTLERRQVGRRILKVSREALERTTTLAVAFHTTGDARFARRAEEEMLAVSAFSDWNPAHFLDVAEMAAAVGLGYDWLYHELPEPTRATIRDALRRHALTTDPADWGGWDWRLADHNWNPVCFGGLALAALAIEGDGPAPPATSGWPGTLPVLLDAIREHHPRALHAYAPDGVYPEGPGYWSYGTTFETLLIAGLRSALGDDLGFAAAPGFLSSAAFIAHARGPGGRFFNFSDNGTRVDFTPALLWMAREAGEPGRLAPWSRDGWAEAIAARDRFSALVPLWWLRSRVSEIGDGPARSWSGDGPNPVAFFREGWTDPAALWLAVKAGRGGVNHGHLDAGSFVLEADGVRWAVDTGGVDYNDLEQAGVDLWNLTQESGRWRVMQHRNEAHNTLTIGGALHRVDGRAAITAFEPLTPGARRGGVVVDLAPALGPAVATAIRALAFEVGNLRGVTVADSLTGLAPASAEDPEPVAWTLMTEAAVEIDGAAATLRQDGRTLRVEMRSDRPGRWRAEPYAVPEGFFGPPLPGLTRLRWLAAPGADGSLRLRATLRPVPGGG